MNGTQILIDALDIAAVLIVLPQVAGASRLEQLRRSAIRYGAMPVNFLVHASIALMYVSIAIGALLFIDVIGITDFVVSEIFDLDYTLSGRLTALAVFLAAVAIPALLAGAVLLLAMAVKGMLWVPLEIARRHSAARILAVTGVVLFLMARLISIASAIRA